MKYLLDSHTFVWLFAKPSLIGNKTKIILSNEESLVYLSIASLWELELKFSKNRFAYSAEELQLAQAQLGVEDLSIRKEHIISSSQVGINHLDPFDLMLCAQARHEKMVLVTADSKLLALFPDSIDARV